MARERLLIVKLGAIGDVIMTLPVAAALKKELPDCHITWLVGTRAAPLLEGQPSVDRVWIIDENIFWKKSLWALLRLWNEIRQNHFQRVYILHWSVLFHAFFWLAGIPERYGFARGGKSFALTRRVPYAEGVGAAHQVNHYLSVVSGLYPQDQTFRLTPSLVIDAALESTTLDRLRSQAAGRAWITLAPGGGNNPKAQMPQRRWPAASFIQLASDLIRATPYAIVILGDASEQALFRDINPDLAPRLINKAGTLSLMESAALIKHGVLFIGNDSGLLHMAGAVGKPTLSFFGPTFPGDKVPAWTPHRILYRHEPCSPCYKFGQAPPCPYGLKCLVQIAPQDALSACQALLASL